MAKKQAAGSIEQRSAELLAFAKRQAKTAKTWLDLQNAVYGVGAKFSQLFPDQTERSAFVNSDAHKQIRELIASLRGKSSSEDASEASGQFRLRLPKSLHDALVAEAEAEGVSLNTLCVTKLAVQLRAAVIA